METIKKQPKITQTRNSIFTKTPNIPQGKVHFSLTTHKYFEIFI
jgi:hypothetical protein